MVATETTPILGGVSSSLGDGNDDGTRTNGILRINNTKKSKTRWFALASIVLGILAMGTVLVMMNNNSGSGAGSNSSSLLSADLLQVTVPASEPTTPYRPICEWYASDDDGNNGDDDGGKKKKSPPVVIQTSMGKPSQQWSRHACYPTKPATAAAAKEQEEGGKTTTTTTKTTTKAKTKGKSDKKEKEDEAETQGPPPRSGPRLNGFKYPDAVLRVNFSMPAFPDHDVPILGFGGAFTESTALNFNTLSEAGQEAVLELLFGRSGLGYSIGRVHINSCDFSVASYSFDDSQDDFDLLHFDTNVTHDVKSGMVGMAKRAVRVFKEGWGSSSTEEEEDDGSSTTDDDKQQQQHQHPDGKLFMYASPWSPPAWMKKPTWQDFAADVHAEKMTYSAKPNCLREGVGPFSRYAKSWALYFSKFIEAYKNHGLNMWAITVQNEPEFQAPWEACAYTADIQAHFVANHLGPQLRRDHPEVKIFIFDHNKDHINKWFNTLLNETNGAAPYVSGTAYHWYAGGMDRLLDGALGMPNMHRLQANLQKRGVSSSHILLGSESCHCPTTAYAGGDIRVAWSRAERYAHTILADLASGSHGWLEWNLLLDGIGGPNHLGNLCETTVLAVPHRAAGVDPNYPPLPPFESQIPFGNNSVGDGRTREELNALGFPAKYLDVGVAVQPMYYYMGHISRYVRPGSVAVPGLVYAPAGPGSGRIFRPAGSTVMGGGLNDLATNGIELTVWPCEGSTRQQFEWNAGRHGRIRVFGHDWLGNPTRSCVARKVDKDFRGFRLTDCNSDVAGSFDVRPIVGGQESAEGDDVLYNVVLLNHPKKKERGKCLVIVELENDGGAYGPLGGAQVALGDCDGNVAARWKLNPETGEAISAYFSGGSKDDAASSAGEEVCLTTGWPFLQMGAFRTSPHGEASKTVVVLNEAQDGANYALQQDDDDATILTNSIPPRSIQTILMD